MLTIKKEAFANEYVANGGNASAAYRHAYNTHAAPHTIAVEASRLLTDPDVALRVSALREAVSVHSSLTASDVASQLREISRLAMERKKYGTAIRALELQGRMIGAFDQR
jgi:phage terminase small subunit